MGYRNTIWTYSFTVGIYILLGFQEASTQGVLTVSVIEPTSTAYGHTAPTKDASATKTKTTETYLPSTGLPEAATTKTAPPGSSWSKRRSIDEGLRMASRSRDKGIQNGHTRVWIYVKFSKGIEWESAVEYVSIGGEIITIDTDDNKISETSSESLDTTYNRTEFNIWTPWRNESGNVPMFLVYRDGTRYTFTDFEYIENPTISGIHPTVHLVSGGTRVTISGTNFDAAESSLIRLDALVNISGEILNEQSNFADCYGISEGDLVCRMPPVDFPSGFIDKLRKDEEDEKLHSNSTRRKRSTSADSFQVVFIRVNDTDSATVFMTIVTDQFVPKVHTSNVTFRVIVPKFDPLEGPISITSGKPSLIIITGTHLDMVEPDNYVISVGDQNCTIISATPNELQCMPPTYEPSKPFFSSFENISNLCVEDPKFKIIIAVSLNQNPNTFTKIACSRYVHSSPFPLVGKILIPICLVLFIALVAIAIAIVAIVLRRRRRRRRKSGEKASSTYSGGNAHSSNLTVMNSTRNYCSHQIPSIDEDPPYLRPSGCNSGVLPSGYYASLQLNSKQNSLHVYESLSD